MRTKPSTCVGCPCHDMGTDFSAVEGTGSAGVMAVCEGSGKDEQRDCLPLRPYAASGGVFERAILRMGLTRSQFSVTNQIRCRPRNDWLEKSPWEYAALSHCRPNLIAAIRERRPRAIWAGGNIPLRGLTTYSGVASDYQSVSHLSGYVLPSAADLQPDGVPIPVVPSFHPAFLRRGKMAYFGQFCRTLQRAVNIAAGRDRGWLWNVDPSDSTNWGDLPYAIHPSLADAESFAQYVFSRPQLTVSYDIETSESTSLDEDAREGFADTHIRLVQFAIDGAGAIALQWEPRFTRVIAAVLRSFNPKVGWNNWLFDNKVIRAAGEREGIDLTIHGANFDGLTMFHHWQPDLPAHLQFAAQWVSFPFPWKHLAAMDIAFYGCCDVDATLRLYAFLESALRREGLWDDEIAVTAA